MRPPSLQFQSIIDTFGEQGWHCEPLPERSVVQARFEAHHTSVHVHAQAFTELNAISIVGEAPCPMPEERYGMFFELIMLTNKQLTIGGFEYDIDREAMVFRVSNLFDREKFDSNIIVSLVHSAIAELDRMIPYAAILRDTDEALLPDLNIERLLQRQDLLPPVPESDDEEHSPI